MKIPAREKLKRDESHKGIKHLSHMRAIECTYAMLLRTYMGLMR